MLRYHGLLYYYITFSYYYTLHYNKLTLILIHIISKHLNAPNSVSTQTQTYLASPHQPEQSSSEVRCWPSPVVYSAVMYCGSWPQIFVLPLDRRNSWRCLRSSHSSIRRRRRSSSSSSSSSSNRKYNKDNKQTLALKMIIIIFEKLPWLLWLVYTSSVTH
jgi:hypothetical protein